MEPNQNPPSERDWTEQEKDEFYASIGLSGTPINKEPFHPSASITYCGDYIAAGSSPLTLDMLVKIKEDLDKQFPEPIKYKDGADMSHETFVALGIPMASKDNGKTWFDHHINPIIGIEIHIVPGMPFGAVEECRCKERYKLKFQALNPLPPDDLPSMVEFTQEMPIEEQEEFFASQDALTLNFNDIPKQPPIEWSTGWWNGPIHPLSSDDPFGDLERFIHPGVNITSIVPPEQGWPIAMYCPICKVTTFLLSPWAIKPEKGDYWRMNDTCASDEHYREHNLKMIMDRGWFKITQEMSIEEAKKRWPNTPVPGEKS